MEDKGFGMPLCSRSRRETGNQALALLRCEPHKGDPSHKGYLRMPQQAFKKHSNNDI